jgi:hypothetical protein
MKLKLAKWKFLGSDRGIRLFGIKLVIPLSWKPFKKKKKCC